MKAIRWFPLLLAVLPLFAFAQNGQAVLSCTAPTTNTDGSAIKTPLTFKFYMGTKSGTYTSTSTPQTSCGYTFTGLAVGTYYFTATAIDGNGTESAKSVEATKTFVASPSPPTNLTVTGSLTAYQLVLSNGQIGFVSVGTLSPGASCDASQPVGNKYVVDRKYVVSWIGNAQPQLVVANCS